MLQATLLSGRYFTDEEVALTRLVTIINETATRRNFAGEEPRIMGTFARESPREDK